MANFIHNILIGALGVVLVLTIGVFWFLRNPVLSNIYEGALVKSDSSSLMADVAYLASLTPSRNAQNGASLKRAASYIKERFVETGCKVSEQKFHVQGNEYTNIICSFGRRSAPRVVIGAHYDVHSDDNPGADDNASGVAAILEIARLVTAEKPNLNHRLDLVAFTLEELPNFRETTMGSYIHAESLSKANADVKLMISVEMIGYFTDEPNSQQYPLAWLRWFYPDRGNFIGVVGLAFDRTIVARAKKLMMASSPLPVYSINAPRFIPAIDFSDHRNYWQFGFPALMVTDTSFLRNPNYHRPTDSVSTLDFQRMSYVVDGLYRIAISY